MNNLDVYLYCKYEYGVVEGERIYNCLIYVGSILVFNGAYIEIGELSTFLGGHREVLVEPWKEVFEEVYSGVGTQELICGSYNYQEIIGGSCLQCLNSMVYYMIDKT